MSWSNTHDLTLNPEISAVKREPIWLSGLTSALVGLASTAMILAWPDQQIGFVEWGYGFELAIGIGLFSALLLLLALPTRTQSAWRQTIKQAGPWLLVLSLFLFFWELLTAKLAILPAPFFAPPQALIHVYASDWPRILDSLLNSVWLLANGVILGSLCGFVTGVSIGWSRHLGYWVHPVLRFLGPIPSTALLPMAFFFFPSGWSAAVFLIALASWFPVTILTWSGVASVDKAYYDVARTLGAKPAFLIFRVAIPAALPYVFVGLFMGLGASFSVLVAAEMMGVKSGLGWYLSWAQGWASYANMYGALIVMALVFSSVISLLFTIRDRVLVWQKGVVQW